MCQKNILTWRKKSESLKHQQSVKDFSLFLKQYCCIVWSVEKVEKVKSWGLKRQKLKG